MSGLNKKVIYLSYDGLTDPLGQAQILPYLCGLSTKWQHRFVVISFEKSDKFEVKRTRIEKICEQNQIAWIPLRYHKNPPVLSTVFDVWAMARVAKKVHKEQNANLVHCRSYLSALVGLYLKSRFGLKFIFDMRGFWADERVEGGLWSLTNPLYALIYKFFKRKEKQFLSQAAHVVSLTNNAKLEMESWHLKHAPITVIPTCADTNLFNPASITATQQAQLRKTLGINPNDFVLLYLGSWGTWYLVDEMLTFFKQLRNRVPDTKFLIVTSDKVFIPDSDLSSVVITSADRLSVPLYISLAHATVCFIKPSFSKKASSATKLGEIMAMRVPILVNHGWGDVETLISQYENGFLLRSFSTNDFEAAIEWMVSQQREKFSNTHFPEQFTLSWAVDAYAKIYANVF